MNENGNFGKFGSAEELLKAYRALEAEFTKRCQRLKIAETALAETREKLAAAQSGNAEISAEAAEKIIEDYLRSVLSNKSVPVLNSDFGQGVLTPVRKPKNLDEAKRLAELMIGKN